MQNTGISVATVLKILSASENTKHLEALQKALRWRDCVKSLSSARFFLSLVIEEDISHYLSIGSQHSIWWQGQPKQKADSDKSEHQLGIANVHMQ